MSIKLKIHNVKNIDDLEFDIPVVKGLYALTGENASGKSTLISCAAAAFYVPSFIDYYGIPRSNASMSFNFDNRERKIEEKMGNGVQII